MNFMMAGMAPVMSLLMMGRDMRAMEPTELVFWGVMSLGVMAGFALAYPVNVWMVAQKMKHGLMTERKPGSRFDVGMKDSLHGEHKEETPTAASKPVHSGHEPTGSAPLPAHADHEMQAGTHAMARAAAAPAPDDASKGKPTREHDDMKLSAPQHGAHDHATSSELTRPQLAAVGGISALLLLIGMAAPANFVNMRLSARDVGGAIMPPGMIMDRDTPGAAMRDMAAVHPRFVTATFGLDKRGD